MNEFANNLTSFSWWLGVVVVGLLINLASAYLKSPIDNFGSKLSSSWKNRTLRSREEFEIDVERAVEDQNWRSYCSLLVLIHRSKSNAWLLVALMEIIVAVHYKTIIFVSKIVDQKTLNLEAPDMASQIAVFVGGIAFMLLAFKSASAAWNLEQILNAAQKQLDKNKLDSRTKNL